MKIYTTRQEIGMKYIKLCISDDNNEDLMVIVIEPYDIVGDGVRAKVTCAQHLYTTIYGEQVKIGEKVCKHGNPNGWCCDFIEENELPYVGDMCPKYNEPVLPDEEGNCSLCGEHRASNL